MENEEAEMTRLSISHAIAYQVHNCIQVEGFKGLIVHVILKVYVTEREEEVASILREMRMALVQRNLLWEKGRVVVLQRLWGMRKCVLFAWKRWWKEGRKWFACRVSINFMLDASGDGLRSVCCLGRKWFARRVSIDMPLRL
ncbi:hypothetical protein IEQ34_010738 [Dendrobium chrysotoxum]|uniref:Uncharacterized protein n=1 Tax=Dendrobium chrysotoxum TaxID=161865 RepID=A0AAV7GVI0_DENCH|nr:hypothetical protein IEQ34_010738 [Dendrobium chrysotoxum]